jgi:hypothetical protein
MLLPYAAVHLQGPEETLTATANAEGDYSFDGLKAAKYRVSAGQSGFHMPASDHSRFSATVQARACALVDVTLSKNWPGSIAGRLVRPDGTPAAAGVDLTLIRLADGDDGGRNPFAGEVHTDDHGNYAFQNLAPGRYKVAVHKCCFPIPEAPYSPIYWPAGTTEDEGSEIVIGNSIAAQYYGFRLPPEVRSISVSGQVLLPSRKPAPGTEVWLLKLPDSDVADDNVTCCDFVDKRLADLEGQFSFKLMEGIKYGLATSVGGEPLSSVIAQISFGQPRDPIVLTLEASTTQKNPH